MIASSSQAAVAGGRTNTVVTAAEQPVKRVRAVAAIAVAEAVREHWAQAVRE